MFLFYVFSWLVEKYKNVTLDTLIILKLKNVYSKPWSICNDYILLQSI